MEEKMLEERKKTYSKYTPKGLKGVCKRLNLYFCSITESNKKEKIDYIIKYEQQKYKKEVKKLIGTKEINYGFLIYLGLEYINITEEDTYIIKKDNILKFKNDEKYDYYYFISGALSSIREYNDLYKKLNKTINTDKKLIDIKKIKNISQLLKYKNLMNGQYKTLENYFNNTKFPNQLKNDIVLGFVHNLDHMKLEFLLKSGNHKFINPISGNTYDSERGVYTTLKTNLCHVGRFGASKPALVFSNQLANDFGYIFNFGFNYGKVEKDTYIKGETFKVGDKIYSAVEKGTMKLCKRKKDDYKSHEVIFYTDHIKLKDYLVAIIFTDEEEYKLFKNMKGIKYKNKMKLLKN